MKKSLTVNEVLARQVEKILPSKEELEHLMRKRKLRLYLGVDPTGKYLHLGHTIALRKLQQFADLGHEAILVVGTGTVLAGDPSQRATVRPVIAQEEIKENIQTWKEQASKVLDFSRVRIRFNGDWLGKLTLPDFIRIASHISAVQLFQRDMFQARIKRGDTVWTHELLYPLLQGYDSVALNVDLEIGGTDQLFNMLVGRELQRKMGNREKYVLCTPMLLGLDGKPMSKTSGNTVNLSDTPQDMYGKLMSMKDELIPHYMKLCTQLSSSEMTQIAPREAKARLAKEIVALYHGQVQAEKAEQEFTRVFREGKTPARIPEWVSSKSSLPLNELLFQSGLASSKSEARRLIEQGGVSINQKTERDPGFLVHIADGMNVQVGKRKFKKIRLRL